jgi:hypothetical protein
MRVFFTNKTARHDITEILLKVALNTIALSLTLPLSAICVNEILIIKV